MNNTISLIVPVYNSEKYLDTCISSIIGQTLPNLEVILIDDGSTDKSFDIIKKYESIDKRIIAVHKENTGVSSTRNLGLSLATGSYIGFVDSDDYLEPTMYEEMLGKMESTNADVVIIPFFDDKKHSGSTRCFGSGEAIKEMNIGTIFMGHLVNKLFKADLWKDVFLDESISIYEDLLVLHFVLSKANNIIFWDKPFYHYIYHENSALFGDFKESYLTARVAAKKIVDFVSKQCPNAIIPAKYTLVKANYNSIYKMIHSNQANDYEIIIRELRDEIKEVFNVRMYSYTKNKYRKVLYWLIVHNYWLFRKAIKIIG